MSDHAPSPTPEAIIKRWILRLGMAFLILLTALPVSFVIWRLNLSKRIGRTLAAIQKAGYPTNLAQLEQKYYPDVAADENAATLFESAFAMLTVTNSRDIPYPPEYQSKTNATFFSPEMLLRINRLLKDNSNALNRMHRTSTATNCRYPINLSLGVGILLPHLESVRNSARLLSLEAVMHMKNGEASAGLSDLNALLRLSHSLDREPVLISQLVRMSTEALAITTLEHMLNWQQFSDVQLAGLSPGFPRC